jgi:transposase-like protein
MARRGHHQEKIIRPLQQADAGGDSGQSDQEHALRIEETYVRVKGQGRYLYRAMDATGATLDFFLSAKQDAAAAQRFLAQALTETNPLHPAGRQHSRSGRLTAGHRKAKSRRRTGGGPATPDGAAPQ